ncbi:hypothetical protein A4X13_0g4998 [Tilletia indica]|uniref:Uncharacterized protein n=1 Tax=Tilletia indica TaxID=43049 RepID=A0A177T7D8_9BASI|nr:hypothetical protein A4X13_0g4998 [Tilletia indica]
MGAVASCLNSIVSAIVNAVTAIFSGIASICITIVRAIGSALQAVFSCIGNILCCREKGALHARLGLPWLADRAHPYTRSLKKDKELSRGASAAVGGGQGKFDGET